MLNIINSLKYLNSIQIHRLLHNLWIILQIPFFPWNRIQKVFYNIKDTFPEILESGSVINSSNRSLHNSNDEWDIMNKKGKINEWYYKKQAYKKTYEYNTMERFQATTLNSISFLLGIIQYNNIYTSMYAIPLVRDFFCSWSRSTSEEIMAISELHSSIVAVASSINCFIFSLFPSINDYKKEYSHFSLERFQSILFLLYVVLSCLLL